MTLAGDEHVEIAIEPQLDRPTGPARTERRDAGEQCRLGFLAAESSAHSSAVDKDILR